MCAGGSQGRRTQATPAAMYPGSFGVHPFAHHHHVDWSKISPEDRFTLGCVVGGMVLFVFCLMGCLLCFDDAPAPAVVRQKVRRAFTAAEKAV